MSAAHETSHAGHAHSHRGSFVHEPSAAAQELYREAFDGVEPDPGRRVIAVELETHEVDWSIAPGVVIRAWAFNGQVPGPVIEGRVGDVLELRLTNRLPEATAIHWHG